MKFLRCTPESISREKKKVVSIIGGGPAGLGAAGYLICKGYQVDIYDLHPELGGLLVFGIPEFRLKKEPIKAGIDEMVKTGLLKADLGKMIGVDYSLKEIVSSSDVTLIATGTIRTRRLNIPGEEGEGIFPSVEWLIDYHRVKYGYRPFFTNHFKNPESPAIIIGAGLTAADAAYIAKLELNLDVSIIYRRTRREAPMGVRDIQDLERKGVKFIELLSPKEFVLDNGHIREAIFYKTKLMGEGRKAQLIVDYGSIVRFQAKSVINAIGPLPSPPADVKELGIITNPDGTIKVNESFQTSLNKVFAAGDAVNGPSKIGPALKSGIDAAANIDKYLSLKNSVSHT